MKIDLMDSSFVWKIALGLLVCAHVPRSSFLFLGVAASDATDIRKLSQDFTSQSNDTSPWTVYPGSNIESMSTSEHRGLLTIHEPGHGQDVKAF